MNEKNKSLEQRVSEYNKFYEYYSWDKDFPLLSIQPKEKVLVIVTVEVGPYAVLEGDTLILGVANKDNNEDIPICAARVNKALREQMPLESIMQSVNEDEYSRIIFDRGYTDDERNKKEFCAKIMEGIDLDEALDEWVSVKNAITKDELYAYNLSLLDKVKDALDDYNLEQI